MSGIKPVAFLRWLAVSFFVALLCVLFVCVSPALADTDDVLSVSYTAQPISMVVPEEVLVRLTLVFSDTQSIDNIRICREDGTIIANVNKDNITNSSPYVLSDTAMPTEKQLENNAMTYIVKYTQDYGLPSALEMQQTATVVLEKLPAVPGIDFTRFIPYTTVSRDEHASIVYRVCNKGNVDITNLFLTDALSGEIARVDKLEPGDRMSFEKNVKIAQDAVSIPKIVYSHSATSDSFSMELAPTFIKVSEEALGITLSAASYDVYEGDTANLNVTIVNNGDVSYTEIALYDEILGGIQLPIPMLNPKQAYTFEKSVRINGDCDFTFTLLAVCETGREVKLRSNAISIKAEASNDDASISLTARILEVNNDGANVELRILNSGKNGIKNVRLSERSRGIFKTLFVLPPGETVLKRVFSAKQGDKLAFMTEITDGAGGILTTLSNEVSLDKSVPRGQDESGASSPVLDEMGGVSLKVPDVYNTYTNMILLATLVLVLLSCIAALSMTLRRRAAKRFEEEREKTVRRTFARAVNGQREDETDSNDITVAVYDDLRKGKKGEPISERDRKPGSI